jgi:ribonuclease HI
VSEDEIYLKESIGWRKHLLISRSSRQRRYALAGYAVDDLPVGALFRGIIEQHPHGFISSGAMGEVTNPVARALDLPEIYAERFGSNSVFPVEGRLTICSDGSYKDGRGTASWVAVAGDAEMGEDLVVPDGAHDSYRSELAGIFGGLRFLDSLPQHQLPGEARFICDGKSALESSFSCLPLQMSMAQVDLLQGIRKCRDSLAKKGVRLRPEHVKGHADEEVGIEGLSADQVLNVRMDRRAKSFWKKMDDAGWPRLGASKLTDSCSVRFAQTHVPGHRLHRAIAEQELRNYWVQSQKINGEVDWKSLAIATRSVKRGKGVFLTKFFSGICGVNKWRKRWGISETDQCPRCGQAEETTSHLWFCDVVEAKSLREKAIDQILDWLRSNGGIHGFAKRFG